LLNRILIVLIATALWTGAACTHGRRSRSNFPTHLPSGVKIRDYPKVTDVEHVAIRINPDSIRFTRFETLKEWFEIEHTATCNKGADAPHAVVLSLKHETPSKSGWHFPKALSDSITTANAGFDVVVNFEPHSIVLKGSQLDLRKDLPTEPRFYEMFFADVANEDLAKLRDSNTPITYRLPEAELALRPGQADTLRSFAALALRCGKM
jgi:hypothetical protein